MQRIEVDIRNFSDALAIARKRGGVVEEGNGMIRLTSGLMEGRYALREDGEVVWRLLPASASVEALHRFDDGLVYDLALSYTFGDGTDRVNELSDALRAQGLRVYVIRPDERREDPLWGVRFREAAFHSQYFVPCLTSDYLARDGTMREMFDLARMTVEHRRSEMFYPLIPLAWDMAALRDAMNGPRPGAVGFDPDAYRWLYSHVMPVDISVGWAAIARLFCSLAHNSAGVTDFDFLEVLAPRLQWIELNRLDAGPMALLHFSHPWLTNYSIALRAAGHCTYLGVHEPGPGALRASAVRAPLDAIRDHLAGRTPALPGSEAVAAGEERIGRVLPRLPARDEGDVLQRISVDATGFRLLSTSRNRTVLFDMRTGRVCFEMKGGRLARLDESGERCLLGTEGGASLLDASGRTIAVFDEGEETRQGGWIEEGGWVYLVCRSDVLLLDSQRLRVAARLPRVAGRLNLLSCSSDGGLLVTAAHDGLGVWTADSLHAELVGRLGSGWCHQAHLNSTGSRCVAAWADGRVVEYDMDALAPIRSHRFEMEPCRLWPIADGWLVLLRDFETMRSAFARWCPESGEVVTAGEELREARLVDAAPKGHVAFVGHDVKVNIVSLEGESWTWSSTAISS